MLKIWFEEERQGYTIQASDGRFLICTKPFNALKTYLYCFVDLKNKTRGPDNMVFKGLHNYSTPEGAREALRLLNTGELEISHRNRIALKIRKIELAA